MRSEKDIDEVLQTDRVFVNVSQGEFAKKADLVKAFGTDDEAAICLRILKEGEMQVSEKERAKQSEELFHEIATIIVEKCVDANTNRALTVAMVERAMKQLEAAEQFRVLPNKSAKQQALKAIPELTVRFPIARAKMLIRVTVTAGHIDATKPALLAHFAQVMNEIPPQAQASAAPYIVVSHWPSARCSYFHCTATVVLSHAGPGTIASVHHTALWNCGWILHADWDD